MELREIFWSHQAADKMADEDVRRLFHPPPGFSSCLQSDNQLLAGPKGSGKSIALRWLCYDSTRSPADTTPKFYGILLTFGRFSFDRFRQAYERTSDARAFFAYFNLYLLTAILEDLARPHWEGGASLYLPISYRRLLAPYSATASQLQEVQRSSLPTLTHVLGEVRRDFDAQDTFSDPQPGNLAPIASLADTIALLESFHRMVKESYEFETVGLLIDGFDQLGQVAETLVPLMSKDEPHSRWLSVKIACRAVPPFFYHNARPRVLEEGRDYHIRLVGYFDDEDAFKAHLREVLLNRFRAYSGRTAITWELIESIFPHDSSHHFSGFDQLARFSAGNILAFLEACAQALTRNNESPAEKRSETVLAPAAQAYGMRERAKTFLYRDLDDQLGSGSDAVREMLLGLIDLMKQTKKGPRFSVEVLERDLTVAEELIASACEFRYLLLPRSSLERVLPRASDSLPTTIEISPTLMPLAGALSEELLTIGRNDINTAIESLRPHGMQQSAMFEQDKTVFLSIPGGSWGVAMEKHVRQALDELPGDTDLFGAGPDSAFKLVTFRVVSRQRAGKYIDNLVDAIRASRYVVVDITEGPTSGVLVEIGIAAGARRPIILMWASEGIGRSSEHRPFKSEYLPSELRRLDVKIFPSSDDGTHTTVYSKWYLDMVHSPGLRASEVCAFVGGDQVCTCRKTHSQSRSVYLRIQSRNRTIEELLAVALRRRGVVVLNMDYASDPLGSKTCNLIRRSQLAVFDTSASPPLPEASPAEPRHYRGASSDVLPLLEAGYALGAGIASQYVYLEDFGEINSPMLPQGATSLARTTLQRDVDSLADYITRQL